MSSIWAWFSVILAWLEAILPSMSLFFCCWSCSTLRRSSAVVSVWVRSSLVDLSVAWRSASSVVCLARTSSCFSRCWMMPGATGSGLKYA